VATRAAACHGWSPRHIRSSGSCFHSLATPDPTTTTHHHTSCSTVWANLFSGPVVREVASSPTLSLSLWGGTGVELEGDTMSTPAVGPPHDCLLNACKHKSLVADRCAAWFCTPHSAIKQTVCHPSQFFWQGQACVGVWVGVWVFLLCPRAEGPEHLMQCGLPTPQPSCAHPQVTRYSDGMDTPGGRSMCGSLPLLLSPQSVPTQPHIHSFVTILLSLLAPLCAALSRVCRAAGLHPLLCHLWDTRSCCFTVWLVSSCRHSSVVSSELRS
jgi:hypothetical protein